MLDQGVVDAFNRLVESCQEKMVAHHNHREIQLIGYGAAKPNKTITREVMPVLTIIPEPVLFISESDCRAYLTAYVSVAQTVVDSRAGKVKITIRKGPEVESCRNFEADRIEWKGYMRFSIYDLRDLLWPTEL